MVTREELSNCDEKEILIQLRMAVAVLEERTANLPNVSSKVEGLNSEVQWMKKVLYTAAPLGPLLAGLGALASRILN